METNKESKESKEEETRLVDIPITDNNIAFNVLISFVVLAQKRGCYSIQESSKIWEAIQKFSPNIKKPENMKS